MTNTHKHIGLFFGLVLAMSITSNTQAAGGAFGGADGCGGLGSCGTTNPWLIEDCQDLQAMDGTANGIVNSTRSNANNHSYQLANNIDCSDTNNVSPWNTNGFEPLFEEEGTFFSGTLNGNGYYVENLYISGRTYAALIESAAGTIENIGLKNVDFSSTGLSAGFVLLSNAILSNIYVTGTLSSSGDASGIAYNQATNNIDNSYVVATITSTGGDAAGAVNQLTTTISNSYVVGNITANANAAGITNDGFTSQTITNNYYKGDVNGSTSSHWITTSATATVNNTFYEGSATCTGSPCSNINGGTDTAESNELDDGTSFTHYGDGTSNTWNFTGASNTWKYVAAQNNDYPVLEWEVYATATTIEDAETAVASAAISAKKKERAQGYLDHVQNLKGENFNEELDINDPDAPEVTGALSQAAKNVRQDAAALDAVAAAVEVFIGLAQGTLSGASYTDIHSAILNWRLQ